MKRYKKQVIRQFTQILPAVALLLSLSTCTVDMNAPDNVAEGGGEALVKFSVRLPGNAPAVRSLADDDAPALRALTAANENHVETIDILIFAQGGTWLYTARSGSDITDSNGLLSFSVRMRQGNYDMVMLANARARVAAAALTGKTKSEVLEALVEEMPAGNKWIANVATNGYKRIPMWGDIGSNIPIAEGTNISGISLTRMLARVDVEVETSVTNFKITSVRVYNYNTKGTLAPTAANWSATPKVATVPGTSTLTKGPLNYTDISNNGKSCAAEIYLFEAANHLSGTTTPKDRLQRTCLVVGGKYDADGDDDFDDETETYYRVDFSTGTGGSETFFDVLRNHHYTFSIEGVSDTGHNTPDGAFEGDTRLSAKVIAWNLAEQNVIAPGQHYLNVSEEEFLFDFPGGTATFVAKTDYIIDTQGFPAGIVVEESEITYSPAVTPGNEWLTLSPSSASGTSSQTITLTAASNTVPDERTAKVLVKAGNLTKVINVKQEEGLLYVGRFGGKLTKVNETNRKWRFERALYIQGKNQGGDNTFYTWGQTNDNTGIRNYWDGKGNTLALFKRSSINYPAANACFTKNSDYASIMEDDDPNYRWFLPAQRQLMAAWVSHNSFDDAYKLVSSYYRSATEADASNAWFVYFGNGSTNIYHDKMYSARVRCVRELTP